MNTFAKSALAALAFAAVALTTMGPVVAKDPSCCAGGNCCAKGVCCAMPNCCKPDRSCCDPAKGVCTTACGCKAKACCGGVAKKKTAR